MPFEDPDETDPMTLTGVEIEVDDLSAAREMAECFIEEYIRIGLSAESILSLFTEGEFAGPSLALRQLGQDELQLLIQQQFQLRGPHGRGVKIESSPGGHIHLPVLES